MDTDHFSELPNFMDSKTFPAPALPNHELEPLKPIAETVARTQMRTWEWLDQTITPADFAQLETDLLTCPDARNAYVQIVQLEGDLRDLLGKRQHQD